MNLTIWDSHNKQVLQPLAIFFRNGKIDKINAVGCGDDALSDGWYKLEGEDLKKISVMGDINHNIYIMEELFYEIYMKGFNDELSNCINYNMSDELHDRIYNLGSLDAEAGDDISSIDTKTKKEILERIKSY